MAKIKKQSLVDQIYSRLREDILNLRFPLGSRINVNEIQDELGVSSTPLREALNRLQQEGLVVMENNVGASVLTLDAHDVEEIEELAFTLQSAAVRFSLELGDRAAMLLSHGSFYLGMNDQVIIKTAPREEFFSLIRQFAPDIGGSSGM